MEPIVVMSWFGQIFRMQNCLYTWHSYFLKPIFHQNLTTIQNTSQYLPFSSFYHHFQNLWIPNIFKNISAISEIPNEINTLSELSLRWRHNGRDCVSNHQPHDCLLNRLFRHRSKKTSKLRVTGLCAGNSPGTGEFQAQRPSYAENVFIWWRHHVGPIREESTRWRNPRVPSHMVMPTFNVLLFTGPWRTYRNGTYRNSWRSAQVNKKF